MTILKDKKVKIRKPHRCWGCLKTFTEGVMTHQVSVVDGEIGSSYTCELCQDWIDNNTDDWDIADWESTLPGYIGYWKDGLWHSQID